MNHTKTWRLAQYDEISKLISQFKIIGIADLKDFPSNLLQKVKKNIDDATFKVTSKNVLKKVLESKGHKDIVEKLPNQPILILTNKNAFELYGAIKKSKARSKAKIGMISPIDIVVPAGDTGLPPGPALSDLKKVGIKAQVRGATIFVPDDTVIVKAGGVINGDVVSTLSKLDIKPVELILDVVLVKEDGMIYSKDVLDIDADTIILQIATAARQAVGLGVEIGYICKDTVEPMIAKAEREAKALDALVNKA
ncbi:MAG TPA: 50S ribosomal protein L10 [archaeon]|mgnify:CR=1 FL=1|jgi:large subunit ribosomal protein L10|nr:50S ribosomal protein L10 [archaeon]HPV66206.1 50S ribosomal protein L10 [archaeon]